MTHAIVSVHCNSRLPYKVEVREGFMSAEDAHRWLFGDGFAADYFGPDQRDFWIGDCFVSIVEIENHFDVLRATEPNPTSRSPYDFTDDIPF